MIILPIVGIDYSLNSPAACALFQGGAVSFFSVQPSKHGPAQVFEVPNGKIHLIPRVTSPTEVERYMYLSQNLTKWVRSEVGEVQSFSIEGYSMGSKNRAFRIGENTGVLKHSIMTEFEADPIELSPRAVKKHATGSGNAGKQEMTDAFEEKLGWKPAMMELLTSPKGRLIRDEESPYSDIVDAYWIADLLTHT